MEKAFHFIELPKEEVLNDTELSYIDGANNCAGYSACNISSGGKTNCTTFDNAPCSGNCAASLFCIQYSF